MRMGRLISHTLDASAPPREVVIIDVALSFLLIHHNLTQYIRVQLRQWMEPKGLKRSTVSPRFSRNWHPASWTNLADPHLDEMICQRCETPPRWCLGNERLGRFGNHALRGLLLSLEIDGARLMVICLMVRRLPVVSGGTGFSSANTNDYGSFVKRKFTYPTSWNTNLSGLRYS